MTESPKPLEKFTLIDVGCGGGVLTEPLGRLGATVIGLDPGQDNITMAESHLPESLKVNVSYVCSTLEDFAKSNPGKEVDGIIMSEVIEHIDKPETVIEVASKLTKVSQLWGKLSSFMRM
jgi:ubiquinone biosynthesis O-methyltransferase